MVALDDVFVYLGTARDVVGLDRQHLLQRIRSSVGFQRPDFHLTKTLATELGFTAQRLLRNQRVWTRRAGVHLVVNQVMQFQIVHITYGDWAFELFAGTAIDQPCLDRKSAV